MIQKLSWFKRARRAMDMEDARNVLAVQLDQLDYDYIRRWCDEHGTRDLFEQVLSEARHAQ